MNLYHLAYISKSSLDGTQQVIEWELESILDSAQRNNPELGITGALLYSGDCFCQVLEGPEASIRSLFSKISQDLRHREVDTLLFETVPERQFGQWAMAYAGAETRQRFNVDGIKSDQEGLFAKQAGRELVASLAELVAARDTAAQTGGLVSRANPAR